jgi:hypothetical protein
MIEEKNNIESSEEPIDPAFLAQVTRKCALYRTAANTEKQKKQSAVENVTNELGGSYDIVENAKREHNDEAFPNATDISGAAFPSASDIDALAINTSTMGTN